MRRAGSAVAIALGIACFGACSSKEATAPSGGSYTITFPSTAAAVATDTVEVLVFDVADAGPADICPTLMSARRSNQSLPAALVDATPTSPCDLAAGRGAVTVSYGVRAVLAIAKKGTSDYLLGCAIQNIGEGSTQVPVQLALATTALTVPPTTCASLSDHCANKCP
jgi:hypothetical protein